MPKRTAPLPPVLAAAQAAARVDICVLPASADGSKRPGAGTWKRYQGQRPDVGQLRKWFRDLDQDGLGFVCGEVSGGLEMFEFDDPDAVVRYKKLSEDAGLWPLVRRIEQGYCESTPGGGVHWFYRSPTIEGNLKLASRPDGEGVKVLIETRGEGGWAVVAPSGGGVHESGKPYVLVSGGPSTIITITEEERAELHALARTLDEMPRAAEAPRNTSPDTSTDPDDPRPGDLFNQRASWADVLEPAGWTLLFTHGEESYWRRPGKKQGVSATTNYHGSELLYVFSTSVSEFEQERGYSKFGSYALLRHGGDFAAAGRQLYADGYRSDPGTSPGPLVAAGPRSGGSGEADQDGDNPAATSASEPVPDVLQEEGGELPSPPSSAYTFCSAFPTDHFTGRYIAYASQMTDAAHEYHEAAALVLMAACTNGVKLRLRQYPRALATNLFVLLVGDTTRTRKSTAVSLSMALLDGLLDDPLIPDKFSDEGLIEQLAMRSGRASLWLPDELGQLMAQMDRKPALKEALLQVYDGKSYDYARHSKRVKGSPTTHEDHDRIRDPHLSVLGLATPEVFDQISTGDVVSGLIPRFALIYPQQRPPRMSLEVSDVSLDDEAGELRSYLRELSVWSAISRDAGTIDVSIGAAALGTLDDVGRHFEETRDRQSVQARLPAMAIKLAMLSALGEQVPSVPRVVIEQRDAQRAAETVIRWGADAVRFASEIGGLDKQERKAQQRIDKALLFIRENGETSRTELSRHMRISSRDLDDTVRTMLDRGDLVEQDKPTGGRPAKTWSTK